MHLKAHTDASPQPSDSISIHADIAADDRHLLNHCLRYEQAVKWITVMSRQPCLDLDILNRNGQDGNAKVTHRLSHPHFIGMG